MATGLAGSITSNEQKAAEKNGEGLNLSLPPETNLRDEIGKLHGDLGKRLKSLIEDYRVSSDRLREVNQKTLLESNGPFDGIVGLSSGFEAKRDAELNLQLAIKTAEVGFRGDFEKSQAALAEANELAKKGENNAADEKLKESLMLAQRAKESLLTNGNGGTKFAEDMKAAGVKLRSAAETADNAAFGVGVGAATVVSATGLGATVGLATGAMEVGVGGLGAIATPGTVTALGTAKAAAIATVGTTVVSALRHAVEAVGNVFEGNMSAREATSQAVSQLGSDTLHTATLNSMVIPGLGASKAVVAATKIEQLGSAVFGGVVAGGMGAKNVAETVVASDGPVNKAELGRNWTIGTLSGMVFASMGSTFSGARNIVAGVGNKLALFSAEVMVISIASEAIAFIKSALNGRNLEFRDHLQEASSTVIGGVAGEVVSAAQRAGRLDRVATSKVPARVEPDGDLRPREEPAHPADLEPTSRPLSLDEKIDELRASARRAGHVRDAESSRLVAAFSELLSENPSVFVRRFIFEPSFAGELERLGFPIRDESTGRLDPDFVQGLQAEIDRGYREGTQAVPGSDSEFIHPVWDRIVDAAGTLEPRLEAAILQRLLVKIGFGRTSAQRALLDSVEGRLTELDAMVDANGKGVILPFAEPELKRIGNEISGGLSRRELDFGSLSPWDPRFRALEQIVRENLATGLQKPSLLTQIVDAATSAGFVGRSVLFEVARIAQINGNVGLVRACRDRLPISEAGSPFRFPDEFSGRRLEAIERPLFSAEDRAAREIGERARMSWAGRLPLEIEVAEGTLRQLLGQPYSPQNIRGVFPASEPLLEALVNANGTDSLARVIAREIGEASVIRRRISVVTDPEIRDFLPGESNGRFRDRFVSAVREIKDPVTKARIVDEVSSKLLQLASTAEVPNQNLGQTLLRTAKMIDDVAGDALNSLHSIEGGLLARAEKEPALLVAARRIIDLRIRAGASLAGGENVDSHSRDTAFRILESARVEAEKCGMHDLAGVAFKARSGLERPVADEVSPVRTRVVVDSELSPPQPKVSARSSDWARSGAQRAVIGVDRAAVGKALNDGAIRGFGEAVAAEWQGGRNLGDALEKLITSEFVGTETSPEDVRSFTQRLLVIASDSNQSPNDRISALRIMGRALRDNNEIGWTPNDYARSVRQDAYRQAIALATGASSDGTADYNLMHDLMVERGDDAGVAALKKDHPELSQRRAFLDDARRTVETLSPETRIALSSAEGQRFLSSEDTSELMVYVRQIAELRPGEMASVEKEIRRAISATELEGRAEVQGRVDDLLRKLGGQVSNLGRQVEENEGYLRNLLPRPDEVEATATPFSMDDFRRAIRFSLDPRLKKLEPLPAADSLYFRLKRGEGEFSPEVRLQMIYEIGVAAAEAGGIHSDLALKAFQYTRNEAFRIRDRSLATSAKKQIDRHLVRIGMVDKPRLGESTPSADESMSQARDGLLPDVIEIINRAEENEAVGSGQERRLLIAIGDLIRFKPMAISAVEARIREAFGRLPEDRDASQTVIQKLCESIERDGREMGAKIFRLRNTLGVIEGRLTEQPREFPTAQSMVDARIQRDSSYLASFGDFSEFRWQTQVAFEADMVLAPKPDIYVFFETLRDSTKIRENYPQTRRALMVQIAQAAKKAGGIHTDFAVRAEKDIDAEKPI